MNYLTQTWILRKLERNRTLFEKFEISENLNASMDFSQIQSQKFLNIDFFIKNYLAQSLEICSTQSGYRHLKKQMKSS